MKRDNYRIEIEIENVKTDYFKNAHVYWRVIKNGDQIFIADMNEEERDLIKKILNEQLTHF